MNFAQFVEAEALKPFILGENDCAHFIARWALVRTGRDGLAIFDGLRRDIAADLVSRDQLLRAVYQGCRSIGLIRTKAPAAGDIGVIRRDRHRCAIKTARGWMFRTEDGLASAPDEECRLLMAWRT